VSDPSTALRINCHGLFNQGENLEPSVATEAAGSNADGYKKSAIQTF
jgi:hypothetical protein